MKIGKRVLSALIAIVMIIGMLPATSFAVETNDYENSWAKNEINYMKEKGILSGYPDGTFKPTNNMSKSEFYKVINGLMGYSEKAENKFLDVTQSDWYYEEVLKGLKANYLQSGELLNARDNITRGEVARIISVVFGIEESPSAVEAFADNLMFPEELRGVVGGLKKNGFINGFPDGTFRPYAEITRAEVVKMLHSISGEIVNVAGTVSKDVKTNLVVNTGDVLLKDMTIAGNLYLTEGIGEGDVTLDNVVVKGELNIKGGGANSVIIKNSKINTVSVDKESGLVRVVFENTTVEEVKTVKEVKIELTNGTVIKVVELDGKVEVAIEKGAAIVYIDVVSNEIIIDSKGTIESIKTTEAIKINGTIVKANSEYKVEEGKSTEVKPTETKPTPPPSSGGSSGGGDGGGGSVTPDPGPDPELPKIEMEFMNSIIPIGQPGYTIKNIKLVPSDVTLTYVSNNLELVTIDKTTGEMTGIASGIATITVTATKAGYKTTTFTLQVTVMEQSELDLKIALSKLTDGMLDDIPYPGDDREAEPIYTLASFVGERVRELIENKEIVIKKVASDPQMPYGYYEVTLGLDGKTASKMIRVDTLTVNTPQTFKDTLRYNIKTIRLAANIEVEITDSGDMKILEYRTFALNGYTLIINGEDIGNPGVVKTYTITFESDGGSPVDQITDVAKDDKITLPADPTKGGYVFVGWFTDYGTFANKFTADTPVTRDITVYAKWEEAYKVGDTITLANATIRVTEITTADSTPPDENGSKFVANSGHMFLCISFEVTASGLNNNNTLWSPVNFIRYATAVSGINYEMPFSQGTSGFGANVKKTATVYIEVPIDETIISVVVSDGRGESVTVSVQ